MVDLSKNIERLNFVKLLVLYCDIVLVSMDVVMGVLEICVLLKDLELRRLELRELELRELELR